MVAAAQRFISLTKNAVALRRISFSSSSTLTLRRSAPQLLALGRAQPAGRLEGPLLLRPSIPGAQRLGSCDVELALRILAASPKETTARHTGRLSRLAANGFRAHDIRRILAAD